MASLSCNWIYSPKVIFGPNTFQCSILFTTPEVLWMPLHWLISRPIPLRSHSSHQKPIKSSCSMVITGLKSMSYWIFQIGLVCVSICMCISMCMCMRMWICICISHPDIVSDPKSVLQSYWLKRSSNEPGSRTRFTQRYKLYVTG